MNRIEFHRYVLRPRRNPSSPRKGALLRIGFSDLETPGVSDLFPWPELGDPPLETWLEILKSKKLETADLSVESPTLALALQAARDEAVAVSLGKPLLEGSILNHALATDPLDLSSFDILEARRSGAPAIKVKIGKSAPEVEAAALSRLNSHWGLRLRLDANERMTRDQLFRFLDFLPIRIRQSIEFIEDPFKFDLKTWSDFHRETEIDVAYDRGSDQGSETGVDLKAVFGQGAAQVLIHKPAWQVAERTNLAKSLGRRVIVTSILGHPIGNLWAASKAFQISPEEVHGCRSHSVYQDDEAILALSKSKQSPGARLVGAGIGHGLDLNRNPGVGLSTRSSAWRRMKWESLT